MEKKIEGTICREKKINETIVRVVKNDVVNENVEALVYAANSSLLFGGGLAGAVIKAGGPELLEITRKKAKAVGPVKAGSAVVTPGKFGKLKCKHLIHAVGPQVSRSAKVPAHLQETLANTIKCSLELAEKQKAASIAIPAISTGMYGFPKELCAKLTLEVANKYVGEKKETSLKEIRLTNIDLKTVEVFEKEFDKIFSA